MTAARVLQMTNADYHADLSAISHSGLDEIRDDAGEYYEKRILKLKDYDREPSADLEFGTTLHNAILRKGEYPAGAKLIPADVLNTQGHRKGAAWNGFKEKYADFELCKPDDQLWKMLMSGARHKFVRYLLDTDGDFEHTIYWHDDEDDVDLKCRCDFLHLDREIIVDPKTTRYLGTLKDCAKACHDFGYHRQAALYQDGVEEMYGTVPRFIFIFYSKMPPFRVQTFELTQDDIDLGRRQNRRAIKKYAECKRTGLWVPDSHDHIERVALPRYAHFEL